MAFLYPVLPVMSQYHAEWIKWVKGSLLWSWGSSEEAKSIFSFHRNWSFSSFYLNALQLFWNMTGDSYTFTHRYLLHWAFFIPQNEVKQCPPSSLPTAPLSVNPPLFSAQYPCLPAFDIFIKTHLVHFIKISKKLCTFQLNLQGLFSPCEKDFNINILPL